MGPGGMTGKSVTNESATARIVAALRELIRALDRRVPHAERPDEGRIGRDAARLRRAAVARIDSLTRDESPKTRFDQSLVDAIMTDDGGPARD